MALGERHRTVCHVERNAYAASVLVARMEDEALDRAPIWDDLTTFDGAAWRGLVDLVTAGLPCQPYSVAGKQRGHEDERALWPHFVRIVDEVDPAFVFLENVPLFQKHFEPVWQRLRDMGFVWAPPLLQTASQHGAPHIRNRFYAMAAHPDRAAQWLEPRRESGPSGRVQAEPRIAREVTPDAYVEGLEGRRLPGRGRADERAARALGGAASDDDDERREGEWCGWVFDAERQTLRHDSDGHRCGCRIDGTHWDSESPPVRVDARSPFWMDQLHAVGNIGAPPVAYAGAFLTLLEDLTWRL
jgi:DNA (cytosine-5)-methyltransferase 1